MVGSVYVWPAEEGIIRFNNSQRKRRTSRKVSCIERYGGNIEKISEVPFESEMPPPADPVESGNLITWTDEKRSRPNDGQQSREQGEHEHEQEDPREMDVLIFPLNWGEGHETGHDTDKGITGT